MMSAIPILVYPLIALVLLGLLFLIVHPFADRWYHERRKRRHSSVVKAMLHDKPV